MIEEGVKHELDLVEAQTTTLEKKQIYALNTKIQNSI